MWRRKEDEANEILRRQMDAAVEWEDLQRKAKGEAARKHTDGGAPLSHTTSGFVTTSLPWGEGGPAAPPEPVYRYIKHDYGFRKVRIDGLTGCQVEQDAQNRWTIYLLRNGATNIFTSMDRPEIAGFFPSLEAAQHVIERIWAALEPDALAIE